MDVTSAVWLVVMSEHWTCSVLQYQHIDIIIVHIVRTTINNITDMWHQHLILNFQSVDVCVATLIVINMQLDT